MKCQDQTAFNFKPTSSGQHLVCVGLLLNNGDAEEIEVEWSLSPAFESNLTESKIVSIRDTSVELSLANLSSIPVITSLTPVYARLRARNENSTSGYSLTSKAWIVADDCDNSQFFNSNFSENDEQWLVDLSMSLSQSDQGKEENFFGSCEMCPIGAICRGRNVTREDISAEENYWRLSDDNKL